MLILKHSDRLHHIQALLNSLVKLALSSNTREDASQPRYFIGKYMEICSIVNTLYPRMYTDI